MADIIFVAVALAFFGLCVLYVRACDRLVRGAEDGPAPVGEESAPQRALEVVEVAE
jgi:hypothetical protein